MTHEECLVYLESIGGTVIVNSGVYTGIKLSYCYTRQCYLSDTLGFISNSVGDSIIEHITYA